MTASFPSLWKCLVLSEPPALPHASGPDSVEHAVLVVAGLAISVLNNTAYLI